MREPGLVAYDAELAPVLASIAGCVPVQMPLEKLKYFRMLSNRTREKVIGDQPVICTDHVISGYQGAEIIVSVIAREDHQQPGPGIYGLHGGGMIMGSRFSGMAPLVQWAMQHDAVCVTAEYRLAPEHASPTPVEDCYAGLCWMAANAAALGFDPARLVIFGGSGGGGLAAGCTLLARDRGGPKLWGQLLQCPMLDDRNETPSALQFDGRGVWDRTTNLTAWRAVLGARCGGPAVTPYEAPARATDLRGLPRTFIDVGGMETFRDEDIAYAAALLAAGGDCELHVWGGAFHGFYDIAPHSKIAKACIAAREEWLTRLLAS